MHTKKSTGYRFIIMFVSLVLIALSLFISNQLQNDELRAAVTTDDVEIVDFAPMENTIYTSTKGNAFAVAKDGSAYVLQNNLAGNESFKKVKGVDGKPLTNVKTVYSSYYEAETSNSIGFFLTSDNKVYVTGVCRLGACGIGESPSDILYTTAKLVDTSMISGTIKKIVSDGRKTFILTEDGSVYVTGSQTINGVVGMAYGFSTTDPLYNGGNTSWTFIKSGISAAKDITISTFYDSYKIGSDGHVYGWGNGYYALGFSGNQYTPVRLNTINGSPFFDVKATTFSTGYGGSYRLSDGYAFAGENGKLYIATDWAADANYMKLYGKNSVGGKYVVEASKLDYFDFTGISDLCASNRSLSFVKNGTFYMALREDMVSSTDPFYHDTESNQSSTIQPYVKGQINSRTKVIKAMGAFGDTWILTEDNKLFYRGDPVKFSADLGITGIKEDETTSYESEEKYNGKVRIDFIAGDGYENTPIKYRVKEGKDGTWSGEQDAPVLGIDIEPASIENKGKRIYREYKAYYEGKEDDSTVSNATFIVDLYNKDFEDVSVKNNVTKAVGDTVTWDGTNGLEGNISTGNITLKNGTAIVEQPTDIQNGFVLSTATSGTNKYEVAITDSYGNSYAVSFSVKSVPRPVSMKFDPTDSGGLKYNTTATKTGGRMGKISLIHVPAADPIIGISSADIVSGNNNNYFEIDKDAETGEFYIKAKSDVPVGSYTLGFSGSDKSSIGFTSSVVRTTITVGKSDNPMKWNDSTQTAITNGKYIDEDLTIGTVDKPAEIGAVTYSIEPSVTGVNIDPTTGLLTITSISANSQDVNIVAKTSGTDNYNAGELKAKITLSKRQINLKTVIFYNGENRDNHTFDLGSPLPTFAIDKTSDLPSGVTLEQLKPDDYKVIRQNDSTETDVTSITTSGTYDVKPVYNTDNTSLSKYKVTWTYATITANAVSITDSNASDYYTLTLADDDTTTYTPDTWTNKNIIITPTNSVYSNMKVDTGSFKTGAQTYSTEGTSSITLTFKTANNIEANTTINNIKIDKIAPTMSSNQYSETNTSTFASFMRTITFSQFFSKEQTVTFSASDGTSGSGIDKYHYTITKVDEEFNDLDAYKNGDGNNITLAKNENYKIVAYALDNAGNKSSELTEYIQISDEAPTIMLDAKIKGTNTDYNGEWTSKGIEITLDSPQSIKQYAWSTDDGTTYIDLPTDTRTFSIPNTSNIDNKTYTFKGTSQTDIPGTSSMNVKIDKKIPTFNLMATTNDGNEYDGSTNTEHDVIITLSQSDGAKNISGVDYYYCSNDAIKGTPPVNASTGTAASGWTKVTGEQVTFNSDTNTTYYFKAVSGAGVASTDVKEQKINITKLIDNPTDLVWATEGNQEVTYGTSIPLTITLGGAEVDASKINITATGGSQCLTYDSSTRTVTAISGTCQSDENGPMRISAKVGNYREPLTKTINTKKAELQLQTKFSVNNVLSNSANILKDGTIPSLSVDYVNGKGLVDTDQNLIANASDLGNFTPEYSNAEGSVIQNFNTGTIGTYKVKNKLQTSSVSEIPNFSSKYTVVTLAGTLDIGDNNYTDGELYEITGTLSESGWYNNKVTINPKHSVFSKMGISNGERKTGEQFYPSGEIISGSNDVILKFEDAFGNIVTKNPTIKIDNQVPDLNVSAISNGSTYNGDKTENDVTITLSQPNDNVSGITYYYCTEASISTSNPTGSGWTKLTGKTKTFTATENKTYYFKAISGAGLVSNDAKSQVIYIEKKETNPVDMDWAAGIEEDLAYGDVETLSIDNTKGNIISYTSTGGDGCLTLDTGLGEVRATSGVCSNGYLEVSAQVGNYAIPLTKTFSVHKVNLDFQTIFSADNTKQKSIFKGDSEPPVKVELINGTALAGAEANSKINDIGTYTNSYTLNGGSPTTGISTDTIGQYKITSKLSTNTVIFSDFNSKYSIRSQEPATLNINDTNFAADQLFTITGNHVNDDWFTNVVTITPIHETFNRISIDGGTVRTGAQLYPGSGDINVDKTINLTFTNSIGSTATINGVPIKIDSVKPTFSIVAQSNNLEYTSGSSTMYNVDINFTPTSSNISGIEYFYTMDVLSNGNVKPDATWTLSSDFTISESGTYYMKAVSGAGIESDAKKFVAKIEKPDTSKKPTVAVTSNGKNYVADGSTWTSNDVTFKLSGNTYGYEVCVSTNEDRSVDCDDVSFNWTTIDNEVNQTHIITTDQDQTYYWFRNKLPGFQTTASEAYVVMLDSVAPSTPQITITEKQNALMSLFARSSGTFHNKAVDVAIDSQDERSDIASITYDVYDKDAKLIKENQSYTDVLTFEDTNIQISAKAIDKAGNVSDASEQIEIQVDTIAPQISGITNEASYYVPYVFISYKDSGSGIDSANTTYTNNDKTEELGNNTLFNGKGTVSVNVQDLAGNASSISFEMLGLPEHMDCSTQSLALIDSVKAQYDEVKGHLNDTQKKEITDWMAKSSSSCSVTDPDHNVTVENPEAKIPENTVLVVDVITTTIDDVELELKENEEVKMAYDVYFKNGETIFKNLEGSEMKVKLPLGAYKEAKGLRLVSVEEDGTTKDIVYVSEGDYAVFTTNELKRYAFIAEKSTDPNINVDTDCDGTPDINIDIDDDGIPEINIDTIGDGEADYNIDIDDDEIPDVNIGPIDWEPNKCVTTSCGKAYCTSTYYKPYLNIDSDGDGRPDINIDLDKDMEADINIDTDFDDIPDIDIDSDGDGKADINIDKDGDGKADQNLLNLQKWNPELNVNAPIKYDTMAGLKANGGLSNGDDDTDSSGKNQDKNQNQVDITPTVKGSYSGSIGGAMTGESNTVPMLLIMLCSSAIILWRCSRKEL